MKKFLLLLITVTLLLGACKKKYPPYNLRIQNTTSEALNDVVVMTNNRANHYGAVQANQLTGYLEYIDNNYSQIRIVKGTDVYTFDLLANGTYTGSPAVNQPAATCIIKLVGGQYQLSFEK